MTGLKLTALAREAVAPVIYDRRGERLGMFNVETRETSRAGLCRGEGEAAQTFRAGE